MASSPKVTLARIARELGISVSTVSRALNLDPSVQEDTRQRIVAMARELEYAPPVAGAVKTTDLVALCLPTRYTDQRHHFYTSGIIQGCFTAMRLSSQILSLVGAEELSGDRLLRLIPSLRGILIVRDEPPSDSDDATPMIQIAEKLNEKERRILDLNLPTVFLGAVSDTDLSKYPRAAVVDIDNYGAGQRAVRYLYAKGHRLIAHIGGPAGRLSAEARRKGYEDALRDLGLEVPSDYVRPARDWQPSEGYRAMRDMLAMVLPRPTAVFCASDALASGAEKAIAGAGLSVPNDISLIGHDNSEHAIADDLTTLDHQLLALAAEGLDLVARLIRGQKQLPQRILRPVLVERKSCADLPQSA